MSDVTEHAGAVTAAREHLAAKPGPPLAGLPEDLQASVHAVAEECDDLW